MDQQTIIRKYSNQGVLIDTNLLMLLFVGGFDRSLIGVNKRTNQFVPEDYDTLLDFLNLFSIRITTPNVLTEVSNLSSSLGHRKEIFFEKVFIPSIQILDESYLESKIAVAEPTFSKLGLTDSAIITIAKGKYLLLTDDFELSQRFEHLGGDSINFNHIRTRLWN